MSEPDVKEAPKKGRIVSMCSHLNKHFIPATLNGKPVMASTLTCALDLGHSGDHSAPYKTVKDGIMVEDRAFWSDAVDAE